MSYREGLKCLHRDVAPRADDNQLPTTLLNCTITQECDILPDYLFQNPIKPRVRHLPGATCFGIQQPGVQDIFPDLPAHHP